MQYLSRPDDAHYDLLCNSPSAMRMQLSATDLSGVIDFTVRYTDHYSVLLLQCDDYLPSPFDIRVRTH